MRYSKSPVSEVILGLTYATRVLGLRDIFLAYKELSSTYPVIEILPPIADEAMVDFRLTTEVDTEKTGEFLLRLRSADKKWLVQIQGNKVFLNWIRLDIEDVGNYVGFSAIRQKLDEIVGTLVAISNKNLDEGLRYLELTYHDRIEWQKYISSISEASKIIRFAPPDIGLSKGFNNLFSRFTYYEERIGGYGLLSMNTATSVKNTQLLRFENTLRGLRTDQTRNQWYVDAHNIQFEQFKRIFTDSLLGEWK